MRGRGNPPLLNMKFRLLINSIRGHEGRIVEIEDGNSIAILQRNGVIGDPIDEGVYTEKVSGPEIIKPAAPEVLKRRPGRPRKDASHTAI